MIVFFLGNKGALCPVFSMKILKKMNNWEASMPNFLGVVSSFFCSYKPCFYDIGGRVS